MGGDVACMRDEKCIHLVGKLDGKNRVGRPRHRRKI
jgi:hypothetical protein